MAQFGAGSELAAQCPRVPIPDGYRAWSEADGPIPNDLVKRANAMASDESISLGATSSYPLPGVTTLIRVEPRVWSRNEKGELVQGCFRVGGIFLPIGAPEGAGATPPDRSGWEKAATVLTVASLAVGTVATLATWGRT